MSYFSDNLKKLRTERNLTQRAVAEGVSISQGNYSGLENGRFEPSLATIIALSDFYGVFIDTMVRPIRIIEEDELSFREKNLLEEYRKLSERDKCEIEMLIEHKITNNWENE